MASSDRNTLEALRGGAQDIFELVYETGSRDQWAETCFGFARVRRKASRQERTRDARNMLLTLFVVESGRAEVMECC